MVDLRLSYDIGYCPKGRHLYGSKYTLNIQTNADISKSEI